MSKEIIMPKRKTKKNDVIVSSLTRSPTSTLKDESTTSTLNPTSTLNSTSTLKDDSPTTTLKDSGPTSTLKDSSLKSSTSSTLSPIIEMDFKKSKFTKGGIRKATRKRRKH
jgi:hypothetical protein